MKRRDCLGLFGGVAAGALAGALPAADALAAPGAPAIGSPIALPAARLLDGRELPAAHWAGKVVVIELWATWCPFCARQNPHLDTLHRKNRDRGLEVIALSIDREVDAVKKYIAERGYQFHVAMFDDSWRAAIGRPKGLPIVWVVDRKGRLARLEIGELFPEDIQDFAGLL
ncbi:TlpA family protein disulfide reductase [Burkholderiaceae bacterium FT117]|uniref:TlpA family protein disulfide reductase n=1 Tax=Zeimonas sediminis TaxID=2944268 RepID=UPI002343239C|nr:TlpA disulfide reductase family protein [Zeimonas sediminis]MCM5569600.1 TlpA family protein disulfide reductase [Zeimonas sediminis]